MKKWIRFFGLSFFSDKISREGAKRGYTNVLLGLILAFALIIAGSVGADMLPFSAHYNNSPDFKETVHALLANPDLDKRICLEISESRLKIKNHSGEYTSGLLVNTFENDEDKANYSINGYDVIVDTRPADALAEFEAFCISNDGKNTRISYEEYLTLSDVARLNFDFKLSYTGEELLLDADAVEDYMAYLVSLSGNTAGELENLTANFAEGKIAEEEFNRAIYELYFENYYPDISEYESNSKVPLLRNYYYHQYIKAGKCKYLFIFNDYIAGSFETKSGIDISFYGFFSDFADGTLNGDITDQEMAEKAADKFIKASYKAVAPLSLYANAMNVFSLIPYISLMPMVVALLAYSILKLLGIDSQRSLGEMFKIVGSYVWFSAAVASILTLLASFFVQPNLLAVLPLLFLFVTLAIRSVIYAVNEANLYKQQLEQQ